MGVNPEVHILGCHAATPKSTARPTAQVLQMKNQWYLIDCGEGTQVELRRNNIKFVRIERIFISHMHGDHFFGLPGLISTFRLLGREKELHVYGPKGIKAAITLLFKLAQSWTNFPLIFHELSSTEPQIIHEDARVLVQTIPLKHRIYTNGFLFREKEGPRKLNIEAARKYQIDKAYFQKLKNGSDLQLEDGRMFNNKELTLDPPPAKSYAYCSDTSYFPDIIPQIKGVDLLYHEATFLESEAELSGKTGHSTARQAATIARDAGVGQLLLGHYSTRYKSVQAFKAEALPVFPRVILAEEGQSYEF